MCVWFGVWGEGGGEGNCNNNYNFEKICVWEVEHEKQKQLEELLRTNQKDKTKNIKLVIIIIFGKEMRHYIYISQNLFARLCRAKKTQCARDPKGPPHGDSPGSFVDWQFISVNVTKENLSTVEDTVEELVEDKVACEEIPHVLAFSRNHVMGDFLLGFFCPRP